MSEEKKDHLLMIVGGKIAKWTLIAGNILIFYAAISWFIADFNAEIFLQFVEMLKNPMIGGFFLMTLGPLTGLILWGLGNDRQQKLKKQQEALESND